MINPDVSVIDHLRKIANFKGKIIHFPTISDYLDYENFERISLHLAVFKEDKKIMNYVMGLKNFDGRNMTALNFGFRGLKKEIALIPYCGSIPVDFKFDSNFYFINGTIIKKE
jgi:hypothetical protein